MSFDLLCEVLVRVRWSLVSAAVGSSSSPVEASRSFRRVLQRLRDLSRQSSTFTVQAQTTLKHLIDAWHHTPDEMATAHTRTTKLEECVDVLAPFQAAQEQDQDQQLEESAPFHADEPEAVAAPLTYTVTPPEEEEVEQESAPVLPSPRSPRFQLPIAEEEEEEQEKVEEPELEPVDSSVEQVKRRMSHLLSYVPAAESEEVEEEGSTTRTSLTLLRPLLKPMLSPPPKHRRWKRSPARRSS